jgi:hypothetical protein
MQLHVAVNQQICLIANFQKKKLSNHQAYLETSVIRQVYVLSPAHLVLDVRHDPEHLAQFLCRRFRLRHSGPGQSAKLHRCLKVAAGQSWRQ